MRFRHGAAASAAAVLLAACAAAPDAPAGPRLVTPEIAATLTEDMHAFVDDGLAPGLITYVVEDGRVVLADGYGVANVETGRPMTPDTVFRIASLTKLITSVAVLMLYEDGLVGLDDPIGQHIPELAELSVITEDGALTPPASPPTIRQLLTHTAGFVYGLDPSHPADRAYLAANALDYDTSLDEMIEKLAQVPLKHQPGTTFEYSVAADILGALVERVSGRPFDVFLRERIFEPLDMPDTDFYVHPDAVDRMAALHARLPEGGFRVLEDTPFGDVAFDPTVMPGLPSGGGGLWSTVEDYSRFLLMLSNGGVYEGRRLLEPETVALMTTNQLPDHIESISVAVINAGFGLGVAITSDPSVSGQSMPANALSWPGIYGVYWWLDQDRDLIVFAVMQVIIGPGVVSPGEVAAASLYGALGE